MVGEVRPGPVGTTSACEGHRAEEAWGRAARPRDQEADGQGEGRGRAGPQGPLSPSRPTCPGLHPQPPATQPRRVDTRVLGAHDPATPRGLTLGPAALGTKARMRALEDSPDPHQVGDKSLQEPPNTVTAQPQ